MQDSTDSSFWQTNFLTLTIAVLAVVSFAGAITLQVLGDDASQAWEAFGGFAIFFAGVHVQTPGT